MAPPTQRFAMAFSSALAKEGHPPERLAVTAVCALDQVDGKWTITTMDLEVHGRVPRLDQRGSTRQPAGERRDVQSQGPCGTTSRSPFGRN